MVRMFIGIITGAALGYAWYYFVGCQSGGCPISGNQYLSTAFGAIIGLYAGSGVLQGARKSPSPALVRQPVSPGKKGKHHD